VDLFLSTRRVQIGGIASSANGLWMVQIARNLTDAVDGFFAGKRYLIHDRDPLYTREFLATLATVGIESVKLPPQSPNLNAYAERFVRTIRENCLGQMILFGEDALRNTIRQFVTHYHLERNHQGLDNRLIVPMKTIPTNGTIRKYRRLGGMLNYYYRERPRDFGLDHTGCSAEPPGRVDEHASDSLSLRRTHDAPKEKGRSPSGPFH